MKAMRFDSDGLNSCALTVVAVSVLVLGVGCSPDRGKPPKDSGPATASAAGDPWAQLLQATPHPYLLPLPGSERTVLDGTYVKIDPKKEPPVHCLRCPDYAPEGGVWKLNLDRGIFRVYHVPSGWQSIGSFVISRDRETKLEFPDRLVLFNDPTCTGVVGMYTWEFEDGSLVLDVIEDTCSIHLRAMNLTSLPWQSCFPPGIEAAITDHWQKPLGCD